MVKGPYSGVAFCTFDESWDASGKRGVQDDFCDVAHEAFYLLARSNVLEAGHHLLMECVESIGDQGKPVWPVPGDRGFGDARTGRGRFDRESDRSRRGQIIDRRV